MHKMLNETVLEHVCRDVFIWLEDTTNRNEKCRDIVSTIIIFGSTISLRKISGRGNPNLWLMSHALCAVDHGLPCVESGAFVPGVGWCLAQQGAGGSVRGSSTTLA